MATVVKMRDGTRYDITETGEEFERLFNAARSVHGFLDVHGFRSTDYTERSDQRILLNTQDISVVYPR